MKAGSRIRAALTATARGVHTVASELTARSVQFYGGCALIGFGSNRLAIVGAILVLHAAIGPFLVRREG
jgi:hypothetical protein